MQGGIELIKEIRESWPGSTIKVVAVTADAFEDTRDTCLSAGFDGWLAKPFRIQDLARVIDIVLKHTEPSKLSSGQSNAEDATLLPCEEAPVWQATFRAVPPQPHGLANGERA